MLMTIRVAIVLAAWWLGIHGDDSTDDGDGNDADDGVGTACMRQPEEHCTFPAPVSKFGKSTRVHAGFERSTGGGYVPD